MLEVFQCDLSISRNELGLTRDVYTRGELRNRLRGKISATGWSARGSYPITVPLQQLVDDFSDRIATGAVASVTSYFRLLPGSGYTAGGRRATSRPLAYSRGRLRPSNEDVGALGEGVAGYYLETYEGLQFEIRPFDVSPDLIFYEPSTRAYVLAEVKSSLHSWPRTLVRDSMELLEILAKTWFIRRRTYVAYVVLVRIESISDFVVRRLKVEVS